MKKLFIFSKRVLLYNDTLINRLTFVKIYFPSDVILLQCQLHRNQHLLENEREFLQQFLNKVIFCVCSFSDAHLSLKYLLNPYK